ncbi:NACHT, LRR and PYD domains-containing protein 1b allele 3 isoform X5 [Salmo trutta]|nr:NACHT, LRR and PYD domains-containing protein 1b allele 3-like isoform X5 [Salmo trutta]
MLRVPVMSQSRLLNLMQRFPLLKMCPPSHAVKNARLSSRVKAMNWLLPGGSLKDAYSEVQLEGEGTYECSVTGLVFEVSGRVLIRYSVLSWSKFGMFLRDSWRFAGPIFNVDCVNSPSSILTSIQFPHSLCLADPDSEMTFSVLHMKDSCPVIEPSVDHSGSHVKWRVSSLSPVGPIVQSSKPVEHHGVVLVYKELALNNSYSFRIYLATNNSSDIKDIGKEVRCANKRYLKVEKPPTCKLDESRYRLMSEPEGDISPADLPFTLAVTKLKGYFEVFFEQPPPFKVSLVETESDQTVWSATIREGDCVDSTVEKPRKRTDNRKRSTSTSEEELPKKRRRCADESGDDGVGTVQVPDVSSKQLMQVAKRLGKEWKQVAIGCLDLSSKELDDIQASEEDVIMQRFKALERWKTGRPNGQATVTHLLMSLQELDDLPNEVLKTLQDMIDNKAAE